MLDQCFFLPHVHCLTVWSSSQLMASRASYIDRSTNSPILFEHTAYLKKHDTPLVAFVHTFFRLEGKSDVLSGRCDATDLCSLFFVILQCSRSMSLGWHRERRNDIASLEQHLSTYLANLRTTSLHDSERSLCELWGAGNRRAVLFICLHWATRTVIYRST
jgi:hypothetical protein